MKNSSKYATIDIPGSMSFTQISKEIEKNGHTLTPARTRLILMQSLEKIIRCVGKKYGFAMNRENAQIVAKEPDFQNTIAFFIQKAYGE